jgi:hypothetical protein
VTRLQLPQTQSSTEKCILGVSAGGINHRPAIRGRGRPR